MKTIRYLLLLSLVLSGGPVFAQAPPGTVVEEAIDSFLATPAPNYVVEIPVIVVRYLPTTDGINIDVSQTTDYWSLGQITISDLIANIDRYDKRVKFSLEEGSKFHGYKNPAAVPYLGYRVVKYLSVYRQIQASDILLGSEGGKDIFQPDYKKEFDDLGLTEWIDQQRVKEVWLWYGEAARPGWPSYDPQLHEGIEKHVSFVESNMASPTTGDISNSYRHPDDLYLLNETYVVYCQNFRRTQAEAVHNHGHQWESIYKYAAERQDGDYGLFVQNFSGWGDNNYTVPPLGRAGDTHHPPNTSLDYDYLNSTLVLSDIEDWEPLGGPTKPVNVDTWGDMVYAWPGEAEFAQRIESQWYVYWMQNMPGLNNQIPHGACKMTNWWQFTADWDGCHQNSTGLYRLDFGLQALSTGVFRPGSGDIYLKKQNTSGYADAMITFGMAGDKPIIGDWDGDGVDTIGIYRQGVFYLRNSNTTGYADVTFAFGQADDLPVAGDWNGDGRDTVGVFRNGLFYLRNSNDTGPPDRVLYLGQAGDLPIAGDWTGKGYDTAGVFRPSDGALYLKNNHASGFADITCFYGQPGDLPVTGDWNGDGIDTIGVLRDGLFLLRNSNETAFAEIVFALGTSGDVPIAGTWGLP